MRNLQWLQKWCKHSCNGSWEHMYGIKIETLDNPGWHVSIDLTDTKYACLESKVYRLDNGNNDWMECSASNKTFKGYGDCGKLEKIIELFKMWITEVDTV